MKIRLFSILFIGLGWMGKPASAQQYVQFAHYMYNTLSVNPAYAGSHEALNITSLYRNQWVGLEGAPSTFTFYAHSPVSKSISLGIDVVNDQIGPVSFNQFAIDLAYTLKTSAKGKLSFGTKMGSNLFQVNTQNLVTINPNDISLQNQAQRATHLNLGFGTYYYTPNFYFGLSSPNILANNIGVSPQTQGAQKPHFYAIAGGILNLSPGLKFKPSTALKFTPNSPLSLDLSAQFLIQDQVWLGAMYRLTDAVGALVGLQLSPQFKVGYGYEFTLSPLQQVNSGSHEIFISYDFNFSHDKILSPRYF